MEDLLATLRNPDETDIHYSYDSDFQMVSIIMLSYDNIILIVHYFSSVD